MRFPYLCLRKGLLSLLVKVVVAEEGGALREIFSRGPRRIPWGSLARQPDQE